MIVVTVYMVNDVRWQCSCGRRRRASMRGAGRPTVASSDLHKTLSDEIERRLTVARAACGETNGEWSRPSPDFAYGRIEDENGEVVTYDEGSPTDAEAEHIALHDPADAIRRYEGELQVLERHAPKEYRGFDNGLCCSWCAVGSDAFPNVEWPCDEIRSLAHRLGVSVDG